MSHRVVAPVLAASLLLVAPTAWADGAYREVDLASDLEGRAPLTDPKLVNPWGLVRTPQGTFRLASNATATSEALGPGGRSRGPTFSIPTAPGTGPTGIVRNGDRRAFTLHQSGHSAPALYIFCGIDGTLSGWNPALDTDDAIEATRDE